jgi:hypothetical protein
VADWRYWAWVVLSPAEWAVYKARRCLGRVVARAVCLAAGIDPRRPL